MAALYEQSGSAEQFPAILTPSSGCSGSKGLADFITAQSEEIEKSLLRHGAILFRGFDVHGASDLSDAAASLGGVPMDYVGGVVPRGRITDKVYNSTEMTRFVKIRLHNELAYQKNYPDRLLFYCQQPSRSGGETFIADVRRIYRELPRAIVQDFERRQVRYVRNFRDAGSVRRRPKWYDAMSSKLSWQDALGAQTHEQAEACCRKLEMDYRWRDNGDLEVCNVLPASKPHPITGEICWFNQILALSVSRQTYGAVGYALVKLSYRDASHLPMSSYFGDGGAIPEEVIGEIERVSNDNTVAFRWQKGDVMMVDNHLVAHGRNPFSGARKVMVSMLRFPATYRTA